MILRRTVKTDYSKLAQWWESHTQTPLHADMVSMYGWVVEGVAACFLYPALGSKIAWMGWPISNPESSKETRDEALDLIFDTIHKDAQTMGYRIMLTTSNTPPVQTRLEKHGYSLGDKDVNHYWKAL